jgi:hypothetical protein
MGFVGSAAAMLQPDFALGVNSTPEEVEGCVAGGGRWQT